MTPNTPQMPLPPLSFYVSMAAYNQQMNQQFYDACAQLTDAERKRDRGAFFQSIHRTLEHLLFGDLAWLSRFWEQQLINCAIGEPLYDDFNELRHQREEWDQRILDWTQTLTQDWLLTDLRYESQAYSRTRVLPRWLLVTHMFNHQTHHRGQLSTLLSQTHQNFGVTDLPWINAFAAAELPQEQ